MAVNGGGGGGGNGDFNIQTPEPLSLLGRVLVGIRAACVDCSAATYAALKQCTTAFFA